MALVLFVLSGCSSAAPVEPEHTDDTLSAQEEAAREYLLENYPTREEMLSARACTEEATGYTFGTLPDAFGQEPSLEGDPELMAEAGAAPPEVDVAFTRCVFELGLEDSFYPPDQQQAVKDSLDPEN